MQLQINGEAKEFEGATLAALMETLGVNTRKVAVELNRAIVPRGLYPDTRLSDGDQIEIVQFIGGG